MRRHAALMAGGALVLGLTGCEGFLTGPGLDENPNDPLQPTSRQLLSAVEAGHFNRNEGQLARQAAIYVQQLSGTNNQQLSYATQYQITEQDVNTFFQQLYQSGGLLDHRRIQQMAKAEGDAKLEGVAKILEAFLMGMAASIWGDLPYREAVSDVQKPKLDPQQQIYEDMQKLLDDGIRLLDGAGAGAGKADYIYGGDVARWKRAANTLKARYHLHTAERLGRPAYEAALAAAQQGINEAPTSVTAATHNQAAGDMRAFHGGALAESNLWAQFIAARSDLAAGAVLVNLLNSRAGDPRLAGYFDPAPAVAASATCPGFPAGYRGANEFAVFTPHPCAGASNVDTETRRQATFRQPLVTWAENQLIMAEALVALGRAAEATTHVNNVRRALGLADLPSPVTLQQVMEEKYIVQFQNIDAWNDYKRTCFPRLKPGGISAASRASEIPGRLPYGQAERLNNPNIPAPSAQPARNWNDPSPCPSA